jgi:hypothetical protein
MKRCFKCGVILPLDEFYIHRQMADGHLNKCKRCTRLDVHLHRFDPRFRDRVLAYDYTRRQSVERKQQFLEAERKRRMRHPEKVKARQRINYAIKTGKVRRQSCEVCGALRAEAHHLDYSQPFAVRWFCSKHHRKLAH